jgi:membrane-bound serine protease (ClpP class)
MKTVKTLILTISILVLLPLSASAGEVKILKYAGIINPVAAEYLGGNIAKINSENSASLIVIMLDTPGGLDSSMRIIIKEILGSSIPVAVYVAPSGSRAASAGTFIAMSAHISAMAPGTSQGAASPVAGGGQEMSRTMQKKVKNDAAAYIRSLAKKRGRNEKWAEEAVRKAVSVDEREALKNNIIDLTAKNLGDLLEKLEGWSVETAAGKKVIHTKGAARTEIAMTERQKFLNIISNPTLAYMLLMLGFYGIMFELSNPGVLLPGIVGAICLILGFYALQSLPVNYAGILLLFLSVIFFVAEMFVPTFGALTLGGVIAMILGGVMLIDSPADYMKVRIAVIAPVAAGLGLLFFFVVGWIYMFKPKKVAIGAEGLLGETGTAMSHIDPFGSAEIDGELWDVRSAGYEIRKGEHLRVLKKEGHILLVEPAETPEENRANGEE